MTITGTGKFTVDGQAVPFPVGDTVGAAMCRAGFRTFSRSFKYHRRRGVMCLTGDCANCLVTIDGTPLERACVVPARAGMEVRRETGFPHVERDLLAVAEKLHRLLPVGFYYKTMLRPRGAWPRIEPFVRRVSGRGTPRADGAATRTYRAHRRVDVAVVGGGVAGLAAGVAAARAGASVYLCEAHEIGSLLPPGNALDRALELAAAAVEHGCEILERATAVGIYEGPLLVVSVAGRLDLVRPSRIVIATGAVEELPVFPGNDLPGVWLGRGAELLLGKYGVGTSARMLVSGERREPCAAALAATGARADVVDEVHAARGRGQVSRVVDGSGRKRRCDALVLAGQLRPRDKLARQGGPSIFLAGDALAPGCSVAEAEESGQAAGLGRRLDAASAELPAPPAEGIVCLCEDVSAKDLELGWFEGFRSTELLKRYTTATMGPCQGAFCHSHLQSFVASRLGPEHVAAGPTTERPPARPLSVEEAAAGVSTNVEARTTLHDRHLELGAVMEPLGVWSRPRTYGDVEAEYWAVRRAVSVMDVGTLGKFLVFGRDAEELLDRLFPASVRDLADGRARYTLMLNEYGYVVDDGLVCRLERDRFYVTFTSSGATAAEAMMRDWADTWGLDVFILDETAAKGAINVCGPQAHVLLERLMDAPFSNGELAYLRQREAVVAGVPCRVIRLGFVGEQSFELHHPSSESVALWDALLEAGSDLGVVPHGTDALRTLRLEKGHLIIGQDTDLDTSPDKLGLRALVRMEKPDFVGKAALETIFGRVPGRRLCALEFPGERVPAEGAPVLVDGRQIGYLTSSRFSPVLGKGVALGWVQTTNGTPPADVVADGITGAVVEQTFYDPEGLRVRA